MSQLSRISFTDVWIWSVEEPEQRSSCLRNKFDTAFALQSSAGDGQNDFRHKQLQHSQKEDFCGNQ